MIPINQLYLHMLLFIMLDIGTILCMVLEYFQKDESTLSIIVISTLYAVCIII